MPDHGKPTLAELKSRIGRELVFFGDAGMPERVAIVWYGYLAALLEWGLLPLNEYDQCTPMLPKIDDNPVNAIFLGSDWVDE